MRCQYCGGTRDLLPDFGAYGDTCYDCLMDGLADAVHAGRLALDGPPEAAPAGRVGGFETVDELAVFLGAAD